MATLGNGCILIAFVTAIYGCGAAIYGARAGKQAFVDSARRSLYGVAILLTVAFATLEVAFLRTDLSYRLVAEHSSTTTPTFFKFTAAWSSQAGSLLLWAWLLALFSSVAVFLHRNRRWLVVPYANAVLLGIGVFFLVLMIFYDNPFALLATPAQEGVGLNPLLRHPSMMFHPPSLYLGYVGFSIPFAFAIGALLTRDTGAEWIKSVRVFTLVAWAFLTLGILLGARWSYAELGWGGYWGWDPVENASLMPWLTGTAFLHSSIVQQRRNRLKVWNMGLIIAAFTLSLMGTFLVRSGIIESIHAFGASTLGTPFLVFIGFVVIGSVTLLLTRADQLRSDSTPIPIFSRESIFLINNLLLVGLTFVIFWGTFFPLISEAVTGTKSTLGAPWYDDYTAPLAVALVLFSGVGPLFAWGGGASKGIWRRLFLWPGVAALLVFVLFSVLGIGSLASLLIFTFAAFSLTAVAGEFWRGTRARAAISGEAVPVAFFSMFARNRRRYGGYIAHIGLIVLLVGVAASGAFKQARDLDLKPGQSGTVDGYRVTYVKPVASADGEKLSFGSILRLTKDGKYVATLKPSKSYFPSGDGRMGSVGRFFGGEATSEVGMKPGAVRDIWTAAEPNLRPLMGPIREANRRFPDAGADVLSAILPAIASKYINSDSLTTIRVIINPMVMWIWLGGLTILLGALIGLWPASSAARRKVSAAAAAKLSKELSKA